MTAQEKALGLWMLGLLEKPERAYAFKGPDDWRWFRIKAIAEMGLQAGITFLGERELGYDNRGGINTPAPSAARSKAPGYQLKGMEAQWMQTMLRVGARKYMRQIDHQNQMRRGRVRKALIEKVGLEQMLEVQEAKRTLFRILGDEA